VSEREFWTCVRDGTRPARGVPEVPPEALPAEVVQLLTIRVGLTDSEVRAMTKAEAIERLNRYWATGG
jgi:hypothetical protein